MYVRTNPYVRSGYPPSFALFSKLTINMTSSTYYPLCDLCVPGCVCDSLEICKTQLNMPYKHTHKNITCTQKQLASLGEGPSEEKRGREKWEDVGKEEEKVLS